MSPDERASGVDVLLVSGQPLWPSSQGGRIRGARLVAELARQFDVLTLAPVEDRPPPGLRVEQLPPDPAVRPIAAGLSLRPRLGQAQLGPHRRRRLRQVLDVERPRLVLFLSSYLAAVAPPLAAPVAVDFVDVEVRRMLSLARLPDGTSRRRIDAAWEGLKARRWEPAVARRAAVVSAPAAADVSLLASWGAPAVHVPHGSDGAVSAPSPPAGPVTFVGSFDYLPNAAAARFLLTSVWPRVRRAEPAARLRLAGRAAGRVIGPLAPSDGEIVSDPPDIDEVYEQAAVVLAPVRAGGGSQVKVTEALARGRVVVATSYSAASAPPATAGAVLVADDAEGFAAHIVHLWRDVDDRRRRETALAGASRVVPTWHDACAPLVERLAQLLADQRAVR